MPKYAYFDNTQPQPTPVIGWYDTDLIEYPRLPASDSLILIPDSEWNSRVEFNYVYNGSLIRKPIPTVDEQLISAKNNKLTELSQACRADILAGFDSDALGTVHHYPASQQDQLNLTASFVASLDPALPVGWTTPFWCKDSTGTWSLVAHTASQIQKAGRDGKAYIAAAITKNATLQDQTKAASTLEEIQAIIW